MIRFNLRPVPRFGFYFYIGPLYYSRYSGIGFGTTGPFWQIEYEFKTWRKSYKYDKSLGERIGKQDDPETY